MTISDKLDYISNAKVNRKQMEYICEIDQEVNMLKRELQRKDNNWNELKRYITIRKRALARENSDLDRYARLELNIITDKMKEIENGK